jgi:hypothetical protein
MRVVVKALAAQVRVAGYVAWSRRAREPAAAATTTATMRVRVQATRMTTAWSDTVSLPFGTRRGVVVSAITFSPSRVV